jgi:hypothetical protein
LTIALENISGESTAAIPVASFKNTIRKHHSAGFSTNDIEQLKAFKDEIITEEYVEAHKSKWTDIATAMPSQTIGGSF